MSAPRYGTARYVTSTGREIVVHSTPTGVYAMISGVRFDGEALAFFASVAASMAAPAPVGAR